MVQTDKNLHKIPLEQYFIRSNPGKYEKNLNDE